VTVEIDSRALVKRADQMARQLTRDGMDVWFSKSQDTLYEADSEDEGSNLYPIGQSAQPPTWDEAAGGWRFSYTHIAAVFHEFGTEDHEVRAREAEVLAFEWPDAPAEVREEFRETFPLVFYPKTEVSGVREIGYVRAGREAARSFLKEAVRG